MILHLMHWKEKLDARPEFKISRYLMADDEQLDRKESHMTASDYQRLLADVFIPAMEEFRAELESRGKLCETHQAKNSTSLLVRHLDNKEIKIAFTAGEQELNQTVHTQYLTATSRVDTMGGKISTDDVLLCLAEFYTSAAPVG